MALVLENGVIDGLVANPRAVQDLPHLLGGLAAVRGKPVNGRCGRCRNAHDAEVAAAYQAIKAAVPALSAGDRATLKRHLGTDLIRVVQAGPTGQVTTQTV